jgi:alkylation response protein AidB-like acyl-CoA dehydrogenase
MMIELTPAQAAAQATFRAFADREIAPHADGFDGQGAVSGALLEAMAGAGYLGAGLPADYGGAPMDAITFGLLCHELGRASASVLSIFTVHTIVSHTVLRWGSRDQRAGYLPRLASGQLKAAFALTEPEVGSDAGGVRTRAERTGDDYVVTGRKLWTSAGAIADVFLVFAAATDAGPTALLIDRAHGVTTTPIRDAFAFRAAHMAQVTFDRCRVPASSVVARPGFGLSHVTNTALDHGRYCIAWGATGLVQACLEASASYAEHRHQFGVPIGSHQLIRRKLADLYTDASAARALCLRAGHLRDQGAAESIIETSTAKYYASRAAVRAALDAVQIHGANGLAAGYPTARYLRDAKVFEIIEGSNEMQQLLIGEHAQRSLAR